MNQRLVAACLLIAALPASVAAEALSCTGARPDVKRAFFGDLHVHGMDGVRFYTRTKVVTGRWPDDGSAAPGFQMPLMG